MAKKPAAGDPGKEPAGMDEEPKEHAGQEGGERLTELYEKMSEIFHESMEKAGSLTEETRERAMQEAREFAGKLRGQYGEDISKVAGFIRRDWDAAVKYTREETRKHLGKESVTEGLLGLVGSLARTAGAYLEKLGKDMDRAGKYHTGEVTSVGSLVCVQCGQSLRFGRPTQIPPCPKCRHTEFKRQYEG